MTLKQKMQTLSQFNIKRKEKINNSHQRKWNKSIRSSHRMKCSRRNLHDFNNKLKRKRPTFKSKQLSSVPKNSKKNYKFKTYSLSIGRTKSLIKKLNSWIWKNRWKSYIKRFVSCWQVKNKLLSGKKVKRHKSSWRWLRMRLRKIICRLKGWKKSYRWARQKWKNLSKKRKN